MQWIHFCKFSYQISYFFAETNKHSFPLSKFSLSFEYQYRIGIYFLRSLNGIIMFLFFVTCRKETRNKQLRPKVLRFNLLRVLTPDRGKSTVKSRKKQTKKKHSFITNICVTLE